MTAMRTLDVVGTATRTTMRTVDVPRMATG